MFLRVFVVIAVLAAVAFGQEVLWVYDFEDVEPGNPAPAWSNPDFLVQSVEGVKAYTAPWDYSGYSIYQTPVPAEHWLELRVRIDDVQTPDSRLDIIHQQGEFRVVAFGYIPSDSLFWATLPDAYCGAYYEPGVMEPGVWYRWLIYSESTEDSLALSHLQFKWWREGEVEPGWLITRQQYACLDDLPMAVENEVSIVCTNASEFYVDWIEARVPVSTAESHAVALSSYKLLPAYPNPFNPTTEIHYSLPSAERVSLRVFNLLGQEVAVLAEGVRSAGTHRVYFEASSYPSGIYIYQLETPGFSISRKMVLVK